ncbi:MAG TPA: cation diffusion facilitator family transporter [Acidimicrobiales bacterium]|jgi:cation diffusion facilitator family transporter|nr:cation diffusion facilitator family transporter [Acidimicrobiales bacterium]
MHLLDSTQGCDPFPPARRFDDTGDRADAQRAVVFSAVGLAVTGIVELVIAVLTGSVGLLGDALHNLSDVSTSLVVSIGLRISRRPASITHPYGYERAEDLAGLGVALVVWASAVFAGVVSIHKLTEHGTTAHLGLGMAAAAVGIAGNQIVARYKGRIGRRIQSATLVADARHSWLDALSSAGALAGLIAVASGLRWADAVAGIVVTLFIIHVGWEITADLLTHLSDGVDPSVLATAEDAAGTVPGVRHAHIRARWMGRSLLVEIEGFVAADRSLEDAERIGRLVEDAVHAAVPEARVVLWCPRSMPLV